jgi:flagellar hook-associated protein 3 FlgL
MRIADNELTEKLRASIHVNLGKLTEVQREISSGKRLSLPSDDPSGVSSTLRYRTDLLLAEQAVRIADVSKARLSAADSSLESMTAALQEARELVVQAGSPTIAADQLTAITTKLSQLTLHAIQLGNANFGGQYIFAGTKTTTPPFVATGDPPTGVTYQGNAVAITADLSTDTHVRVDVPGSQGLLPAMQALIQVRQALESSDRATAIRDGLSSLDTVLDGVLQVQGGIGARVNRLEAFASQAAEERLNLKQLVSSVEEIDLPDAIVRLDAAKSAYEATLGAAARVVRQTLLDFLR